MFLCENPIRTVVHHQRSNEELSTLESLNLAKVNEILLLLVLELKVRSFGVGFDCVVSFVSVYFSTYNQPTLLFSE